MSLQTQLHVRIAADGSVTAETKNVTGAGCLDYINVLENLLEATTVDSAYTTDYTRTSIIDVQGTRNELGQS